jgi:hypothetical protein
MRAYSGWRAAYEAMNGHLATTPSPRSRSASKTPFGQPRADTPAGQLVRNLGVKQRDPVAVDLVVGNRDRLPKVELEARLRRVVDDALGAG